MVEVITIKTLATKVAKHVNATKKVRVPDEVIQENVETVLNVLHQASLLDRDDTLLFDKYPLEKYELETRLSDLRLAQEVAVDVGRKYANVVKHYSWETGKERKDGEVSPAKFREAQEVLLGAFKQSGQTFSREITLGVVLLKDALDETGNESGLNVYQLKRLPVYVEGVDSLLRSWVFGEHNEESIIDEFIVSVVVPKLRAKPEMTTK